MMNGGGKIGEVMERMLTIYQRKMIGGGLRLLLLGAIFYMAVNLIAGSMSLLYPYINPQLLFNLRLIVILGYFIPGALFLTLTPWAKYLDLDLSTESNRIPGVPKVFFGLAAILACVGILGIRSGVQIIIRLREIVKGVDIRGDDQEKQQADPQDAFKSYRTYLIGAAVNQTVYGFFFIALVEFIQVIEVDLSYPMITQSMLVGIEIWTWITLLIPGFLFIAAILWVKPGQQANIRNSQHKMISLAAILSMVSVLGLTIGTNLIKYWDMIYIDKNGEDATPE